ncbi:hypothetical protein FRB95_006804 [Tulasnella sp. JGI-2019a]|nr:hypothetical protein FRB95_006804 [Tulasnella sp. JGI-2019a]
MTNLKIIIALIVVCVVLLCIVIFLVVWYRRSRTSASRSQRSEEVEMVVGIQSPAIASPMTPGDASPSAWEIIEAPRVKVTRDRAGDPPIRDDEGVEVVVEPTRRPAPATRAGSSLLSSAWAKTLNIGGYTHVDRPRSALVRPSSRIDPPKTPRAKSFPAALPSTQPSAHYPPSSLGSSYSLTQQTSNQPLLPNISPTYQRRRGQTLPIHISSPIPSPLPSPSQQHATSKPSEPEQAVSDHLGSPTTITSLPPSPPSSPGLVARELEFGEIGPRTSTSRPSTAGTHNRNSSANHASIRQSTIDTANSSRVPSISTLSGSSGRFSNLFFAPMATSSPPQQHTVIAEDRDFTPPPQDNGGTGLS